jgi:hypothetical protein
MIYPFGIKHISVKNNRVDRQRNSINTGLKIVLPTNPSRQKGMPQQTKIKNEKVETTK